MAQTPPRPRSPGSLWLVRSPRDRPAQQTEEDVVIAGAATSASPAGQAPRRTRRLGAAGAMAAQLSQAAGSLVISVLAVRAMPLADFAALSVLLAAVVVVTGLTSGLVGDSLTVLDRADPVIRTALRRLLTAVMAAALLTGSVWTALTGLVGTATAAAFGVLLALWVAEDVLRRLLMANLRFWPIVAVDTTHLAVSSAVALGWPAVTGQRPTVGLYLVALCCGQVCAALVALPFVPPADRRFGPTAPGGVRRVLAFGVHRSIQAALRPTMLLLMRVLVIAVAGALTYGHLEAARLYAAPALLVVNGFGSYLLSTFAADRHRDARSAVRRADRAGLFLTAVTLGLTALAMVVCVVQPGLVSPTVPVSPVAVASWGLFTGAVAVSQPYGALVAVRGGQARVLVVRALDTCISLAAVGVGLGTSVLSADLAPAALAVGPLLGALLLRPMARRQDPAGTPRRESATSTRPAA